MTSYLLQPIRSNSNVETVERLSGVVRILGLKREGDEVDDTKARFEIFHELHEDRIGRDGRELKSQGKEIFLPGGAGGPPRRGEPLCSAGGGRSFWRRVRSAGLNAL